MAIRPTIIATALLSIPRAPRLDRAAAEAPAAAVAPVAADFGEVVGRAAVSVETLRQTARIIQDSPDSRQTGVTFKVAEVPAVQAVSADGAEVPAVEASCP
jgi:hypothetical protein